MYSNSNKNEPTPEQSLAAWIECKNNGPDLIEGMTAEWNERYCQEEIDDIKEHIAKYGNKWQIKPSPAI